MEQQLIIFTWTRKNTMALLESVTPDQAMVIPNGFNNNLLWNAGHVVWAQQILVYHLAGLPTHLPDDFEKWYATGTIPSSEKNSVEEFNRILGLLEETVSLTTSDFKNEKFKGYNSFKGKYDTIDYHFTEWEQAFQYNNIHEARHYGIMLSLKQCLPR